MLPLRSFVRRLLVQALVSSIVMVGIQATARLGPDLPRSLVDWIGDDGLRVAAIPAAEPRHRAEEAPPGSAFQEDRTRADVKDGRLAVWREREARSAALVPKRSASNGPGTGLSDVILFDRCRPGCESRDPLLAFNRAPPATPAAAGRSEAADAATGSPDADGTETVDAAPSAPEGDGLVAGAARSGVSWARRIAGSAGSVVGW